MVDASAIAELINPAGARHRSVRARIDAEPEWVAPHLIDIEVLSALRRQLLGKHITAAQFKALVEVYEQLTIRRVGHLRLLDRIRQLCHNHTSYDAAYIALAEALDCPLITCDGGMGSSNVHHAVVEVIA